MAEHRKRYIAFAEFLVESGLGVITYDLPGHGESADDTLGYFGDEDGCRR
jgi:alpha-beta hydrolase superfamily lysophospholipase